MSNVLLLFEEQDWCLKKVERREERGRRGGEGKGGEGGSRDAVDCFTRGDS